MTRPGMAHSIRPKARAVKELSRAHGIDRPSSQPEIHRMPKLTQLKRQIATDSRRPYFVRPGAETVAVRWPAMARREDDAKYPVRLPAQIVRGLK